MRAASLALAPTFFLALLLSLCPGDVSTLVLGGAEPPRDVTAMALGPPGPCDPAAAHLSAADRGDGRESISAAIDATPIGERRARAVAMTVFSLGTVIGAGFLAVFLIKRLL